MKLFTALAVVTATLLGGLSIAGNGIERGKLDDMKSLKGLSFVGVPLNEAAKIRVAQIVENAMASPLAFSGVAYTEDSQEIAVDQGITDRIYSMTIATIDESGKESRLKLVLKEFSFSNPAFDNFEVLELNKKRIY
ncbi:MAG: hypothetical protein AB7O96_11140 [Pseudobdellovibrionaceae bacterium]